MGSGCLFLYLTLDVDSISLTSQKSLGPLCYLEMRLGGEGVGELVTSPLVEMVSDHGGSRRPVGERQSQLPP